MGVIEVLLRRAAPEHWVVADGVAWKRIRKFRPGQHRSAETRNVMGLALFADEHGFDVIAFAGDRDRDLDRERDVLAGIESARREFRALVIGGCAVEEIEARILAMRGEHGSEKHGDAKQVLARDHEISGGAAMIEVVESANLDALPEDAQSLRSWLAQAMRA
jgi:hypothetical protein